VRPGPSALPVCGWCVECVAGFGIEKPPADRPPVVLDAFDDVSAQLELGDDGGRAVNPAGVQLGESDGLFTGLAQSLEQPLLLGVRERHRPIVASSELGDASSVSESRSRVSPSSRGAGTVGLSRAGGADL
jgi:hypothetical protein